MNDILITHSQRLSDKQQILQGTRNLIHCNSKNLYLERQRQRQKKQNAILNHFKKGNKTFNGDQLKKNFLYCTIEIMNAYLKDKDKMPYPHKKSERNNKTTEQSQKSSKSNQQTNKTEDKQFILSPTKHLKDRYQNSEVNSQKELCFDQNNNFYQTYINLFVTFFNLKSEIVNPNSIKSIIRPNNRFVLIDLLKALLEYARNDLKTLIKDTSFFQGRIEKITNNKIFRSTTEQVNLDQNQINQQIQEVEIIIQGSPDKQRSPDKQKRRVQTQPQINSPRNNPPEFKELSGKISPTKQFRTKNSTTNFIKHHSTEYLKSKVDEAQQLNDRYLHANFIDSNIKQTMYQKNFEFVSQINLQKLQSKVNNLYIELHRLNCQNNQIISKYYEQSLGKKNKFNYDLRGLYSQNQIKQKKNQLFQDIQTFQSKTIPNHLSNSFELADYAVQYTKYKGKCEEYEALQKQKNNKLAKLISQWVPIKVQFTQSIIYPLRLDIQQTNINSGETQCYHWKKYKKQFSIAEFFKQKVKLQFQRIQSKITKLDKNQQKQIFKKKKFRKSLFLDSRKNIHQFIQSNNIIFTKKQSIFPVLKGIQQNYMKNMNNYGAYQNNYALQNNLRTRDARWDQKNEQKIKYSNMNIKTPLNFTQNIIDKEKRFESIKKSVDIRDKSQRKLSEADKQFGKIPQKQRQKTELLSRLSVKYDLPIAISNRQKQSQKYEKKNLISMSKIVDLRHSFANQNHLNSKIIQGSISNDKKLTILNLT